MTRLGAYNLYNMVVLPALSNPNISTRTSFLPIHRKSWYHLQVQGRKRTDGRMRTNQIVWRTVCQI
jgi:hypothetical protein